MGKKSVLLAAALAVAGLCILLWPVVSGHRLQADMSAAAQGFWEEARQPYSEVLTDLQEYNERIYAERQAGLADALACEEPAVLLRDCGVEDEIIGVLEIPTLELVMPVYLGASDSHLAAGAAVLGNTSAPIGGVNTNCVIAGHAGCVYSRLSCNTKAACFRGCDAAETAGVSERQRDHLGRTSLCTEFFFR